MLWWCYSPIAGHIHLVLIVYTLGSNRRYCGENRSYIFPFAKLPVILASIALGLPVTQQPPHRPVLSPAKYPNVRNYRSFRESGLSWNLVVPYVRLIGYFSVQNNVIPLSLK